MRIRTSNVWLLTGILFFSPAMAHANLVKWSLDGVKWNNYQWFGDLDQPGEFVEARTATGWFLYDAQTHVLSDWQIDAGSPGPFRRPPDPSCLYFYGVECNFGSHGLGPTSGTDAFDFGWFVTPATSADLRLVTRALTDQGGTVSLELDTLLPPAHYPGDLSSYKFLLWANGWIYNGWTLDWSASS
jgi:hypothetical protein